jgi:NADP-dependent 3-hydroxy acid dehydrogenase YdfG
MIAKGEGTVITISSLAALNPNLLGGAAYGAAKAAVKNFMTFLHNTYRNQGIRATTILPGETDTPIMDNRARPPLESERAVMLEPRDVARAVLLCATLQKGAMIPELHICPTFIRDTSADIEAARWVGAPNDTPDKPKQ